MKYFLFNTILVLSIGCQSPTGQGKSDEKPFETQIIKDSSESIALFENRLPFEIMQWNIGITPASSAPDTTMCAGWNLSTSEMENIIASGRQVDSHTWHYEFSVLPCIREGVLRQKGQVYSFTINAGSWFSVHTEDSAYYYGVYEKDLQRYFLESSESTE